MIRNPLDLTVSTELAKLILARIEDPESDEPVTLGAIRRLLIAVLPEEYSESENLHHVDDGASLIDEIDMLIDQFGEDANAADFLENEGSEQLSRVIQAVMESSEAPPTLHDVRDALFSGLAAELVATGVLEEDEDETLVQEVDDLCARFGEEALAERFMRYE